MIPKTSDEILAEHPYHYWSAYKRCAWQRDLLKRRYDSLRDQFIDCSNHANVLEDKIKAIRGACHLPMTEEEMKGYGHYEKRCLEKVEEIVRTEWEIVKK